MERGAAILLPLELGLACPAVRWKDRKINRCMAVQAKHLEAILGPQSHCGTRELGVHSQLLKASESTHWLCDYMCSYAAASVSRTFCCLVSCVFLAPLIRIVVLYMSSACVVCLLRFDPFLSLLVPPLAKGVGRNCTETTLF